MPVTEKSEWFSSMTFLCHNWFWAMLHSYAYIHSTHSHCTHLLVKSRASWFGQSMLESASTILCEPSSLHLSTRLSPWSPQYSHLQNRNGSQNYTASSCLLPHYYNISCISSLFSQHHPMWAVNPPSLHSPLSLITPVQSPASRQQAGTVFSSPAPICCVITFI